MSFFGIIILIHRLLFFRMFQQSILPSSSCQLPVIAVCGATGTGKSKLAISLASVFDGEVINFDALQLYRGLTIATNKVSPAECQGIPHHLIDIFPPENGQKYDVHAYRNICLPVIENVRNAKKKLAILAGGTHYYLEAVLWKDFLASKYTVSNTRDKIKREISFDDPKECYDLLSKLRPSLAAHLHPNNVRKVKKALLDVLSESEGESTDDTKTEDMNAKKDVPNRSVIPRYPGQSLILWLDCASDVLNTHLNKRVDMMLESGLIGELDSFLKEAKLANMSSTSKCTETEITDNCDDDKQIRVEKLKNLFSEDLETVSDPSVRRGVLQSIGFKEFSDYLALLPNERDSPEANILLNQAVESVKSSTRQYARRQVSWIRNRFLRRPVEGGIPVYRIDVTAFLQSGSIDIWNNSIVAPVVRLIYNELKKIGDSAFIEDLKNTDSIQSLLDICPENCCPTPEPFSLVKSPSTPDDIQSPFICSVCSGRIFTQKDGWEAHLKSKAHQKRTAKHRKRLLIQKAMETLKS
ncbi:unnamed protein product [Trichobilharzia szidati]|nr:unnamed protein product [Trichobilharzia szidati]